MEIKETFHGYKVRFPYNADLITSIKNIPGREYNPADKEWFIPKASHQHLLEWARHQGMGLSGLETARELGEPDPMPDLTPEDATRLTKLLKMPLFHYQSQGVAYNRLHKRTMIGDQPGLGKSAQSIASVMLEDAFPHLVICPATLKENWAREWRMWTHKKPMILSDRIKTTFPLYWETGMADVFIVNFESLKKYFVKGIRTKEGQALKIGDIVFRDTINIFKSISVDESHRARNEETFTTKACIGITNGKKHIFCLTGTPLVNKPKDLRPQLRILQILDEFGGYSGFNDRYCNGINEASNLKELNFLLRKNGFFQRKKDDVLEDLPSKVRSIMRVEIANKTEYDKEEQEFQNFLEQNTDDDGKLIRSATGAAQFRIMKMKFLAAKGKIDAVVEYAEEVVQSGEKIVIVAHHKEIVSAIKARIPGSVTVVGDDSMDQRQRNIDRFQKTESVKCIILSKSGEVGITLTASSRVAFIEFPWTAASCDQFEDRCHRIGQKDSVQATYFSGLGTVDSHCLSIIERKRKLGGAVTGNEDETELSIIDDFIGLFKTKKKENGAGETTGTL